MMGDKIMVPLTLVYLGENYRVQVVPARYQSLMTLISDLLAIPGFGLCCGMGSCGTCLVEIADSRTALKRPVLACGIQVNDGLSNAYVFIPDRVY
ncbi:2Fe-2S iron-sulfur cluster binding domain-containing protein [Mucilaginibacter ginsenosidivorans]|uniref:2Fe-2S iron-sulfur cluster binding domain-containing protein n=1 Tax=Mucilaginibacter ginsenosidivorans TaxID=398053 RepID=A0A5B8UV34_9SPHI|nr:2Fe-2S iron-sulfur cluster binding domain-containing protein [Mucilaginibacter ginsenosidivorans]